MTGGIQEALQRAQQAANGKDVRIGGGPATIPQLVRTQLIDELHLAIHPIRMGADETLFARINLPDLGYRPAEHASTELAMHALLKKSI